MVAVFKMNDIDKREKIIGEIAQEAAYQMRQGIFPNAVDEIKKAICSRKFNLDSILHALKEVKRLKPAMPERYFWRIVRVQSGNFNYNEYHRTHAEQKEEERKKAPEHIKKIFDRINQ